jgi:hypothetical protein
MFGLRKQNHDLERPLAAGNPEAQEVLRVWAIPGAEQIVTLKTMWKEPGIWGVLLVDVARHAALAYERQGHDPRQVLDRIRELFDAEWSSPTDDPKDVTDAR